jgi:cyclopropane-fatty-acyl-phospholipid synthase
MKWELKLVEKDYIPDILIRRRIKKLLKQRLREETKHTEAAQQEHVTQLIAELKNCPIAIETKAANDQHYEIPAEFFRYIMGKHMKYSACYWDDNTTTLDAAEEHALQITCSRAEIRDGIEILELGCGWGSLTMYIAEHFPTVQITGVSNSAGQKSYITEQCKKRGLSNVQIITSDINYFSIEKTFDRIISVEMFEHMRNYEKLLEKIAGMLHPEGKLFVHIFTHKNLAYTFDVKDETDWMSKYFFTGGIMPSDHLLFYFNKHLSVKRHWRWDGTHYEKTANAWLANMDANAQTIYPVLESVYGKHNAAKWRAYWRIFFMACAELWGYNNGREWFVSHYLFEKNKML